MDNADKFEDDENGLELGSVDLGLMSSYISVIYTLPG